MFKSSRKHTLNQTREVTHQRLKNDKTALDIKHCANAWNSIPVADETFLYTRRATSECCFVNQV